MPRRVKDYIEISDYTSLSALIRYLEAVRDTLPEDCEPELTMRGDDVFGRRLTISYMRELTPDEASLEGRYSATSVPATDAGLEQLRAQLDTVPYDDHASGI